MKLYFVRHGESEANIRKLFCGHTDVELTEKGKSQAVEMAKIFENIDINKIYASPLKRAYNTAMEISKIKNIEIIKDDLIKERYFGDFEGLSWEDIESRFPEEVDKFMAKSIRYTCVNGETIEELLNRCEKFISKVEDNSVVVAHAVLIRAMLSYLNILDLDKCWEYEINNCNVIMYEDGIAKKLN